MAVTPHAYDQAVLHLINGDVNFSSDTIKAILLASYTYSQAHNTLADVLGAGTEATGGGSTGYTTRGLTLTSKTITNAGPTNVTTVDSADVVWTTAAGGTLAGAYVVFYKDTGTNSTSYVLAMADLGGTQTASNGGAWTYATPSGILSMTAS